MISIIIPVYNVEKFIRQCLDSILSQSYKNYEVILIDDKSKDSSLDIIRKYETKYSNFFVIENKKIQDQVHQEIKVLIKQKANTLCLLILMIILSQIL